MVNGTTLPPTPSSPVNGHDKVLGSGRGRGSRRGQTLVQRWSKNCLMQCPALPTGLSSSLNTSQLLNIRRTSDANSSLHL